MGNQPSKMESMEIDPLLRKFYKNRIVSVSGSNGFIGSNLVRALLQCQAKVRCLVRDDSKLPRLQEVAGDIEIIKADLSVDDEASWRKVIKGSDIIFHLGAAGVQSRPKLDGKDLIKINTTGSLALLYACNGFATVKRFVAAGSCFEYGNNNKKKLTETDTLQPADVYGASKAAFSLLAPVVGRELGKEVIILRLFHAYGPYESESRLIPSLIKKALKNESIAMTKGEQVRDFVYIEDVVDAFLRAGCVNMNETKQKILNIGSGQEASVKEAVHLVKELIPTTGEFKLGALPYRHQEMLRLVPDISEAEKFLHWKPKYGLREGLKKTIDWMKQNDKSV